MALSALALCSRSLLKLGAQPIASLDEGTAEAEVAATLYPAVRDALLSLHPWSFATAQEGLPRLAARPVADFASFPPASCARSRPVRRARGGASPTGCSRTGCTATPSR